MNQLEIPFVQCCGGVLPLGEFPQCSVYAVISYNTTYQREKGDNHPWRVRIYDGVSGTPRTSSLLNPIETLRQFMPQIIFGHNLSDAQLVTLGELLSSGGITLTAPSATATASIEQVTHIGE